MSSTCSDVRSVDVLPNVIRGAIAGGAAGGGATSAVTYGMTCSETSAGCSWSGLGAATLAGAATGAVFGAAGGAIASGAKAFRSRSSSGGKSEPAPSAKPEACTHSFAGNTLVLMADGSRKPIAKVAVGDKITNSVPGGGTKTQTHTVGAVIVTKTDYNLVKLTIATTDSSGQPSSVGTVTTTTHHPFYDITQAAFIEAGALHVGDQLQQPNGHTTAVLAVDLYRDTHTTTYDLTIPDLHTYYVLAGAASVLVHNCDVTDAARAEADIASSVRPSRARPAVAEALQLPSGEVYSSPSVRGTPPELHPFVQEILDDIPVAERGAGHGSCGLVVCVSQALTDGRNPSGSSAAGVTVRGSRDNPMHGAPVGPCDSCVALEDAFDLDFVTAR